MLSTEREKVGIFQKIRDLERKNLYRTPGERIFFSSITANIGVLIGTLASVYMLRNQDALGIQVSTSLSATYLVLGMHIAFDMVMGVGAIKLRNEANHGIENFFFRFPKTG